MADSVKFGQLMWIFRGKNKYYIWSKSVSNIPEDLGKSFCPKGFCPPKVFFFMHGISIQKQKCDRKKKTISYCIHLVSFFFERQFIILRLQEKRNNVFHWKKISEINAKVVFAINSLTWKNKNKKNIFDWETLIGRAAVFLEIYLMNQNI